MPDHRTGEFKELFSLTEGNIKAIARQMGIHEVTAHKLARKLGLEGRGSRIRKHDHEAIIARAKEIGACATARELGIPEGTVKTIYYGREDERD